MIVSVMILGLLITLIINLFVKRYQNHFANIMKMKIDVKKLRMKLTVMRLD